MGNKGEGGIKYLKKWVTSFMDGKIMYLLYLLFSILLIILEK